MEKQTKSAVVTTRLEASEAERLSALAQLTGRTPSTFLRHLIGQATVDEEGHVVVNGVPLFQDGPTLSEIDQALDALDRAEQAKQLLASVRAELTRNARYRM